MKFDLAGISAIGGNQVIFDLGRLKIKKTRSLIYTLSYRKNITQLKIYQNLIPVVMFISVAAALPVLKAFIQCFFCGALIFKKHGILSRYYSLRQAALGNL